MGMLPAADLALTPVGGMQQQVSMARVISKSGTRCIRKVEGPSGGSEQGRVATEGGLQCKEG